MLGYGGHMRSRCPERLARSRALWEAVGLARALARRREGRQPGHAGEGTRATSGGGEPVLTTQGLKQPWC